VLAFLRIATATAVLAAVAAGVAGAANMLALTSVARAYGFMYVTESTQAAVELSRPGLSILVRAGDPRYQVNDDIRYLNAAPVFHNDQIYVDASFEGALAQLAAAHPWPAPAAVALTQDSASAAAVLTIAAKYVDGMSAIDISGTGPAGLPVSVELKAQITQDLPTVLIGRASVTVGSDGRYDAIVLASSITLHDTTFVATASGPNATPVTTHVQIQLPNQNLKSPINDLPKG
jgi:hypothetical protein